MRFFNWMFNKRGGLQESNRYDHRASSLTCNMHKEEFSHWPESLFSIGTFGAYDLKEAEKNSCASNDKKVEQDLLDLTYEDVATLVKKLEIVGVERGKDLLSEGPFKDCSTSLPYPKCENCKSISNQGKIVFSNGMDFLDETTSMLKKRSISFFIIKLFACHGGFAPVPAPEFRDPFYQSKMQKLLKSILRKKIYPRNGMAMPTSKYVHRKHQEMLSIEETAAEEKGEDGEKWVKTDSEFIVLEI